MRSDPQSFLIVNPFGIGDVLFTTPLIHNLHERFPRSRIFYLCNQKTAPLLDTHPFITKTFVYDRDDFVNTYRASKRAWLRKWMTFIGGLRREKIAVALDVSLNTQYGFVCWLAGIRRRLGLDYKKRGLFLTRKVTVNGFDDAHVVCHYLDVLRLLGVEPVPARLEVFSDPQSRSWVDEFLKGKGLAASEKLVGVVPAGGASWGVEAVQKQWPPERFIELVKSLNDRPGIRVALIGSLSESGLCDHIARTAGGRCINTAGALTLKQLIAFIQRCAVLVSNNAGPLHIAVASGVKTVCISGPVDENVYGQFPPDERDRSISADLPCRPCYQRFRMPACERDRQCLRDIPAGRVLGAIDELLAMS